MQHKASERSRKHLTLGASLPRGEMVSGARRKSHACYTAKECWKRGAQTATLKIEQWKAIDYLNRIVSNALLSGFY